MKIQNYYFKPSLKITLLTLLFLPVLISLGIWQLHRADFKKQLQIHYQMRATAPSVPLISVLENKDVNFLRVSLQGTFDAQHLIFLDNKAHQHRSGYHVLAPLRLQQPPAAVLVDLGWIAQGASRQHLPNITLPAKFPTLQGVITEPPQKAFYLGSNADPEHDSWPLRLQQVDIALISQKLGYPIAPFVVVLTANQPLPPQLSAFVQDWEPVFLNPQRHIGYAVQWFALAATLVILFLMSSLRKQHDNNAQSD